MIRKVFQWIFKEEIRRLQRRINEVNKSEAKFRTLLDNVDVGIDYGYRGGSWAVVHLKGKSDFIKFINLGDQDIREIGRFLRNFRTSAIDASPRDTAFLRAESNKF